MSRKVANQRYSIEQRGAFRALRARIQRAAEVHFDEIGARFEMAKERLSPRLLELVLGLIVLGQPPLARRQRKAARKFAVADERARGCKRAERDHRRAAVAAYVHAVVERVRADQAEEFALRDLVRRQSGGRASGESRRQKHADRDRRILELHAAGKKAKRIASAVGLSDGQVRRVLARARGTQR